jgi:polar amino acid transport system substrate-binding protein
LARGARAPVRVGRAATGRNALTRAALTLLILAASASLAFGDSLADVRRRGELVWGADQEGGGPYVYPRDDDPNQVTGFEVEIAQRLAAVLGVSARFFQGQWDKMPELLQAGQVDVVLNGYEWTSARLGTMDATIPYFVYGLQLLARKDDATVRSADDLAKPSAARRKIGVLVGSAAETYARSRFEPAADVVPYDGNTDTMREVETGKLDATIEDTPIAVFYAPRFPRLRAVGAPAARGYYVVYARKGDGALVAALDQALIALIRGGELEHIYRRWGLWSDAQRELATIAEAGRFYGFAGAVGAKLDEAKPVTLDALRATERIRGLEVVRRYGRVLLQSAGVTVILSLLSFPLAIGAGLLIALGRLYGPTWLRPVLVSYVEFLRGTPLMLQLYFVFFFLPEIGIAIPAFWTAIFGLAINYSAYESEIYRAGLQAVPRGQMEAALSLGMSRALALRRIVVPQAVRIVIPPVVNDFIALFKDTSVCSVVTVVELTKRFSVLSQSTQATIELMILTAILYMAMSTPLTILSRRLEQHLGVSVA